MRCPLPQLFVVLAAALFLNACARSATEGEAGGGTVAARMAFHHCNEQTALIFAPESLMPALPPGFAYTTPAGQVGVAAIHISGASCDDEAEQNLFAFALIDPPEAFKQPDIPAYAIALGGYTNQASTHAMFEAWGLSGLFELAPVEVSVSTNPLLRIGTVTATGANGSVITQMNASGPSAINPASHTRAYFIRDGVLRASLDAIYSAQEYTYAAGTVIQQGEGPLPVPTSPAVGTHAVDYELEIGDVRLY